LRHPVDRAYSAFWHFLRLGRLPLEADFAASLGADTALELRTKSSYFEQLSRYLRAFRRDKLSILLYDEIQRDPVAAVANCLNFLGIESFIPKQVHSRVNGVDGVPLWYRQVLSLRWLLAGLPAKVRRLLYRPASIGSHALKRLPMKRRRERLDVKERRWLFDKYFRQDVQKLERLIDRDLNCWRS
jgi:hypothetical protein